MNYKDPPQTTNRQLLINTAHAVKLINHHEIIFIKADNNYSKIYFEDHTDLLLSKTLGVVEYELNDEMFFRCHRTYLVNVLFIKEICKGNGMCIILKNGSKIPLAKRRLCDLRKLISENSKITIYSKYRPFTQ